MAFIFMAVFNQEEQSIDPTHLIGISDVWLAYLLLLLIRSSRPCLLTRCSGLLSPLSPHSDSDSDSVSGELCKRLFLQK